MAPTGKHLAGALLQGMASGLHLLIRQKNALSRKSKMSNLLNNIRLDYVSCMLTILGTILLGKKLWQGWVVAAMNSVVVCVIGVRTAQFGFVPANLLCIALYTSNVVTWRFKRPSSTSNE